MTKQTLIWNHEPSVEIQIQLARETPSFLPAAQAHPRLRPVYVSLPSRRRESCLTRRAMLAALREAEFDEWQATGGDYLDHMHQPID